jgi:uncharacterized protein (DUF697 family)
MTITRAKKTLSSPARQEKQELTADEFIAGADTASPAAAAQSAAANVPDRERQALVIVKQYIPWAAGAGVLPLPGIDLVAIVGVQLRMLDALAKQYDVPFKEQAAKSIIATLMATVLENTVAGGIVSALKFVPVFGTLIGIAALPTLAAAGTYAVGKVFITHFEAGGTFLDFEPNKVRAHFRTEFDQVRKNV